MFQAGGGPRLERPAMAAPGLGLVVTLRIGPCWLFKYADIILTLFLNRFAISDLPEKPETHKVFNRGKEPSTDIN